MSDVAEIAKRLSEAQRRAILSSESRQANGAWHPAGWYLRADRRVRYRLCLAGLLRDYLAPSQRLTPLGLAVREHLQSPKGSEA